MSSDPCGHFDSRALFDERDDPARELNSAALNSNDHEVGRAVVELNDLVGHSFEGPLDGRRGEDSLLFSCTGRHQLGTYANSELTTIDN
jgi:hypothetical protein